MFCFGLEWGIARVTDGTENTAARRSTLTSSHQRTFGAPWLPVAAFRSSAADVASRSVSGPSPSRGRPTSPADLSSGPARQNTTENTAGSPGRLRRATLR